MLYKTDLLAKGEPVYPPEPKKRTQKKTDAFPICPTGEPKEPIKKSRKKITHLPSPSTESDSPSSQPPPAPKKRSVKRKSESEEMSEETVEEPVVDRKRKREVTKQALEEEKKALEARLEEAQRKQQEELELKEKKKEALKLKKKQKADLKALEKNLNEAYASELEKIKTDREEPPPWFKKYIGSVKKEENAVGDKKPKKAMAEEIETVAEKTWNDGVTRDRVKQEVDNHMSRMYSQIFGNRRKV